jgi:hypothetical protein
MATTLPDESPRHKKPESPTAARVVVFRMAE